MSQFERIAYMDRALREDGAFQCRQIAARYEVSERQVKRDIEYMRDRLNAPVVYDREKKHYRYERPFEQLRFADERLLIFYALLKDLALNEHYVPVVTRDLLDQVEQHVSHDYRRVADQISYELSVSEPVAMEDFTSICQAMRQQHRLDIEYRNARGEQSSRSVEPERLVNYGGRWYLIAFDLLRKSLRTFHLSRISHCAVSRDPSLPGKDPGRRDAVNRYIESGFGMFNGPDIKEAVIRIYGPPAALVARQRWHPAQRISTGTTHTGVACTDITLPVSDWRELLGRVLSFGSSAEAVSPAEFRRLWQEEIRKMADRAE